MLAEYYCVKVQCMIHWSAVGKSCGCGGGGGVKVHGEWYGQQPDSLRGKAVPQSAYAWSDIYSLHILYSSQHLKWIKKDNQSCPKTRTHFGFRTTLMKGFDQLQMLTCVCVSWPSAFGLFAHPHEFIAAPVVTVSVNAGKWVRFDMADLRLLVFTMCLITTIKSMFKVALYI